MLRRILERYQHLHLDRLFAAILCFVLALLFFWIAHSEKANHERTTHWPETHGKLTSAEYSISYGQHGDARGSVDVEYTYEVEGQTYENDRVSYARVPNKLRYQDIYEHGQAVIVKYDPNNPADSVLEDGIPPSKNVTVVWVGLLCAAGLYLLMDCREKE